jgi:energy-coupling factor transporter transmembrane protein EcfT
MGKFLLPFLEGRHTTTIFSPTSILVASFVMGVILALQTQVLMVLSLIILILLIGTIARTRWRVVLSLSARFEIVILFWILLLPFFYGSSIILTFTLPWGQVPAYWEGLYLGVLIGLRIFGLITLFLATLSHMSLGEFIGALKTLRVPSSVLGSLLIMLRYIPLFLEERRRMQEAQQLRGFERGERMDRIRSLGFLVGSTIDRAMDRSIVVYESMTLRGFGRGILVAGAGLKKNDVYLGLGLIVLILLLINWQTLVVLLA